MEGRELPVGWIVENLGSMVNLKTGPFGSSLHKADYVSSGIPVVNPMHILNGRIVPDQKTTIAKKTFERLGEFRLEEKDVVLGRRGEMGRAAVVRKLEAGWLCGTGSLILRQHGALVPDYLQRYLSSPAVVSTLEGESVGSTMVNLNQGILRSLDIPVPPLNEQRRIAVKLDITIAAVEACRQRLDGVAAILKRFRQAVLAAATSGELTREWREERGDFSHWQEKGLAELGEFGRGRSRHRPRNDPRLYGGDYPFIQTGDVANAKGDWLAAHSQTYSNFGLAQSRIWPRSTLCITIAANIADTALLEYPACFPDSVVGFVADRAQVEPLFAKWMIDSVADKLESFAPATAQKNINLAILDQIVFSVPPLQEQTEIISRAQHLFTLADQLEARLTAAHKVVDRLTPALLAKAFRGELVPQDPNDEPASVLLERIRAARQAEAGACKPSRRGRKKAATNPDQIAMEAAPVSADFLTGLLRECGALSERALLAVSELEPKRFQQQLYRELESGTAREVQDNGQVLLEAVG
jgi:type I restriction enzyme S subunit